MLLCILGTSFAYIINPPRPCDLRVSLYICIEHARNASVGAITDFTPSVPAIKFIKEKPKKKNHRR